MAAEGDRVGTTSDADQSAGGPEGTPDAPSATSSDEPTSGPSESPPTTDDRDGDQRDEDDGDDPGLLPVIPDPGTQAHR
jgi:hypothetical protein